MARVRSSIPRGFTRFYTLYLISESPLTGKEIIVEAEKRSEGEWSPSPGLIYPLLGRLLRDGLITEKDDGRFLITEEGLEVLDDRVKLQEQWERQYKLVTKLGMNILSKGKMIAEESLDRIVAFTSIVKDRVRGGSADLQDSFDEKYYEFLMSELKRLEKDRELKVDDVISEES
ncbi:putative transcriptional regulator [Thaumarchaeota archaeon SCGC AB-539-E09]|nr:putative transcriptional regulator [Thaumarchaeota archaeon SCGC AB-539-E09]